MTIFSYDKITCWCKYSWKDRKNFKIDTTYKLSKIIEGVLGFKHSNKKHPATKSFQAIRIAINNELNNSLSNIHEIDKIKWI